MNSETPVSCAVLDIGGKRLTAAIIWKGGE